MSVDPSTSAEPMNKENIGADSGMSEAAVEQPQQQPLKPARNDQNAMFLRAARAGNLDQVLEFLRAGIDINTCNSNGLNALHLASKEGHNEVVRELLRRGAAVDAATRKGNTALHIASLAGQDIIVTILVEHGANVNAQSLNGFSPLYMAAQENHEMVVRYLLAHGANQALATEDGFTPLAVALQQGHDRIVALLLENDNTSKVKLPALHIAAKKDDTRAATLLLQNEQNPNVTSKSGFTPLHIASHYGNEGIAQLLIEKGANVNFQARHNISPLHVAAKWGRVKLVELLLDRGAIIDCRTRDLLTPLHCAARSGHDAVVEVLLDRGAPIAAKTKNGLAPLHMAAQGDHVDCARILLYHRANVDEVTVDYLTPLHVAAHCGHVGVAKLLLDRQADPNARALNGFTPLHIACKKNRIKVVELLLKYHASVEATTESGLAPLHVAAFMGCINIVIFLLQQGANVNCETVRGETPLHLAARANQTDIVRVLVRNKANVDAQARELQTPLHIAARLGNADIAHILLNAHANPNAATQDQYTPLHIAAKEGQEEVVQLLLEKKANKTLLTKKGFSPLHLAAKYGNYAVVKLLLDRGTPVDIEGKNQVTPLHVASHYNNERVAQLLLESGARAQACAKNGYTPLHIAAKKNQMEIAHALLAYRADPNAESRAGFTPLHLASEEGHVQMVVLLTEKGSQVNARAKNGLTPMHLCAQEDRVDVADQLFANGANVNEQTNAGYTPLHVACHFGQIAMVKWLIEHGANVDAETRANYTPLHQAAQQGHNHVVRYLLEHGASPNTKTASGQTPLAIAQRLGYVSVVETLRTVTETTVITETTTITEERYRPQNPEAMNETMFSDSEDEADDHQAATAEHARDFNESITQGLRDSAVVHLIHTGEQQLNKSGTSPFDMSDADLEAVIKRAQQAPISTAIPDPSFLDNGQDDNVALSRHELIQPSFLISFLVDARGGAMRGCRHSGVRVIIPPRKAAAPIRITCRYLKKEKLSHPPPLSEGEALASRILEMGPHGAKFLGPVILEVPHFASLRGREREIVILRSDDGQHWKEHQLEATEDAVQEVLNESFDAQELQQLDELHTSRITRILTSDFPMYFAVVTRVRQEVHCVGPEGGVILSSVVPRVQAIFPDGSLTKTIKVSLQAQPVPQEIVTKLHGNRVAVSPIVTVEPRRRKFHKPITLCIPLPQSINKGMLTQHQQQPPAAQEKHGKEQSKEPQPQQEPPTLRLLCSITGGSAPAQWEDITGTTQLTFTGDEISFTTTVSARFWLMDCQTPRDAARMAQEIYQETIAVPFMAKFVIFARRPFPTEGQLRMFCMTDDKEEKTLEKQEGFQQIAKSRDVEVLGGRHQWLEFAGNLVPVTKRGDQLSIFFQPFQENRLAFNIKVKQQDDQEAASAGKVAVMKEPKNRADTLPPQHPICTLTITLPDYSGPLPALQSSDQQKKLAPISQRYADALSVNPAESCPNVPLEFVAKSIGADWARLGRALGVHPEDIRQIRREMNSGSGQEPISVLKIWISLKGTSANEADLEQALRQIGRDDIVHRMTGQPDVGIGDQDGMSDAWRASQGGTPVLQREYSSKSSLGGGGAHIVQSAPVAAALSATPVSSTAGFSPTPSSVVVEQPIEPLENVETVVTRTERFVHHSEEANEPVVDEKITQQIFRDGQEIQRHEMELHDQPLNEQEQAQWESMGDVEERDRLARSREAMIIDGEERHLIQVDDGGRPIEQTTVQTTTLIASEHQMPIEEVEEELKVQEPKEPSLQREPSQGSEGSVVIHSEEPGAQEQQQIAEQHEPEPEQQPLAEQFQTSTTTTASTVSSAAQPQGYEAAGEEGSSTAGDEARGANHLEPAKSDKNGQEEQQIGEEWTRGPPDVQQSETIDESFPVDEGAQMITKKRTHILSTSQSKVQGLEDLENAPAPASGTQSTHAVTVHSSGPPQKEDNSLSLSLTTSTSSTSSSVKEKVARFESMAAADKEAEEAAAKKRFGWRPSSRESARSAVTEAQPTVKRGEEVQEESGAKSSRIPTRSPTSPSRARLHSPVHVKNEDETAANVEAVITLERQPEEVHLKYSMNEEAAAIHKASQPADSTKHEVMVDIANERIIDDSAPKVNVSHSHFQESPEPAIIIVEASSHELSTIGSSVKEVPRSEELIDEELHHKEVVKEFETTNEEDPTGPVGTKTGEYVPFGAETEADQREKPEPGGEGSAKEEELFNNEPIDTAQEEHFKLRRISMDTDKVGNKEEICIESPAEESEAIREEFSREIRPELFVTTGLDLHKVESSDAKMVEKEQDIPLNEEGKMNIEEEGPEEVFDKKEASVEERHLQQAPSVESGEHLPETELQTEIHFQSRPESLIIHSSEQETDHHYGEEKEPKYITEKMPSEEILVRKDVTPENIMDEIIPVQNEMRSTAWLCTAPVRNSPYEEEELTQMKALFWPEDDKRITLKHAPVAEIPFWFSAREVTEEIQPSPVELESDLNNAEAVQKEQQMCQGQHQTVEEVQERKEFEEEHSVPNETDSTGECLLESVEENKQEETKINFDYPTAIEESPRIEPKAVEIEQSAMETTERTISSQKVPPPLSPLQSEESITREESLLGGSTDDDGDERSSTHTVIHRPDVLVEIESSQTRSLYGTVEGQESNLPRPGFDESNTQGIETNTPTTPVMNASRWKSLDDRSSIESHHTPSPIIEITPAPEDENDENEKALDELREELENVSEKEETEREETELPESQDKQIQGSEEINTMVSVSTPPTDVHDELQEEKQDGNISDQRYEKDEIGYFEEEPSTSEFVHRTEESEQEDKRTTTPPLLEKQEILKTVKFEVEEKESEDNSQKEESEILAETLKKEHQQRVGDGDYDQEPIANEEDLLVDSEPLNDRLELEQTVHFDEEGHSPNRIPHEALLEQEIKFEDEDENIAGDFEIVDSSQVLIEQQSESPAEEKVQDGDEETPESNKPQLFSEIGETQQQEKETLPTQEEARDEGIEGVEQSNDGIKKEQNIKVEKIEAQKVDEKESREKKEDEASLLGMASAIQAEILVEEAINRVLADGIPSPIKSPETSQKPSPEPASDDWELLGEEKEIRTSEPNAMTAIDRNEDLLDIKSSDTNLKSLDRTEDALIPEAAIPTEEFNKEEEAEDLSIEGESDEEDAELVQLHIEKQEEEAAESPVQEEEQIPESSITMSGKSLLAPMVPMQRPKSPIPPPVAATPPQFQKVGQSEMLEGDDEMLLTESKMPEDVLDLGDDYEHAEPSSAHIQKKPLSPPDTTDLMRVHEEMLSTGGESLEPGDEGSSGDAGPSLTSSPSKKRRSTSSSLQGGLNGAGGAGSTEGSLLEFERLEQEVIDQTHSELAIPKGGIIDESEKSGLVSAAHVAVARESADSISGSVSSLTEFEQLEREVREAVGLTGEEIMVLSDIREESEEGIVEEEQPEEEDDVERMSTREDDDEEMKPLSNEELSKTEDINLQEDKETIEKVISIEPAMLSSADSLEVERTQHLLELEQPMETSVDSLELNRGKEVESTGENDSLEGDAGKALEVPTSSGNGNGSPIAETGEAEQTVFETTRINPTDGSAERLIRTAITRVRDPIHSRVRFVGTEDEQQVQAILDGAEGDQEMEVVDEEGNVTHLSIRTEHEAVH